MKNIYKYLIAFALFILVEYLLMLLYLTFLDDTVSSGGIIGNIIGVTITFGSVGLFIFVLAKEYKKQRKLNKNLVKENDTIE